MAIIDNKAPRGSTHDVKIIIKKRATVNKASTSYEGIREIETR
jgi:hypothetical protein